TISQLLIGATQATNVTLQTSAAGQTLSINGAGATNNLAVSGGSTLIMGTTTATFTLNIITTASQKGDISGTLQVNASNTFINTNPIISGLLTMTQGALALNGQTLTLNGTITGTGATLSTISTSILSIGGTSGGAYGVLNFTGGSNTLGTLTVNRTGSMPSVD